MFYFVLFYFVLFVFGERKREREKGGGLSWCETFGVILVVFFFGREREREGEGEREREGDGAVKGGLEERENEGMDGWMDE